MPNSKNRHSRELWLIIFQISWKDTTSRPSLMDKRGLVNHILYSESQGRWMNIRACHQMRKSHTQAMIPKERWKMDFHITTVWCRELISHYSGPSKVANRLLRSQLYSVETRPTNNRWTSSETTWFIQTKLTKASSLGSQRSYWKVRKNCLIWCVR